MNKQTIISAPSIADVNAFFSKWKSIPGNQDGTLSDFYGFLTRDTPDRSDFLKNYALESYFNLGNIVVLKITPKYGIII